MGFAFIDYAVLVLYLTGITVIGIILSGRQRSTSDYFLAGHLLPWWAVLFSVAATETSTLTFSASPPSLTAGI